MPIDLISNVECTTDFVPDVESFHIQLTEDLVADIKMMQSLLETHGLTEVRKVCSNGSWSTLILDSSEDEMEAMPVGDVDDFSALIKEISDDKTSVDGPELVVAGTQFYFTAFHQSMEHAIGTPPVDIDVLDSGKNVLAA